MKLVARPLQNPYVRLEPLEARHREPLRPLAADPSLWVQTTLNASTDFDAWFDAMLTASAGAAQMSFAVFDRRAGAYAGHTSYLAIAQDYDRVEIGWTWYGRAFHRTHVNPASKRLLFAHAFRSGAARVELKAGTQNLRSQGAMTKMGAVREGVLRSHTPVWSGGRRDTVYFSVLSDEWPAVRDGLDARLAALSGFAISEDDPARPDVTALLRRHLAFTREHSPEGACYALDVEALKGEGIVFWTASEAGRPVGCIALKALEDGRGEIKSMHVAQDVRGRGAAQALLSKAIERARANGWTWLGLETGRSDGFAPSAALYASAGFEDCAAFPPYHDGGFSRCMSRSV
ncbi:MAG: GNAT family N-acetyltransferase [Oceanicaulis sp.]